MYKASLNMSDHILCTNFWSEKNILCTNFWSEKRSVFEKHIFSQATISHPVQPACKICKHTVRCPSVQTSLLAKRSDNITRLSFLHKVLTSVSEKTDSLQDQG